MIRVAKTLLHKSSFKSRCYQKVNKARLLVTSPNSFSLSSLVIWKFPVVYFFFFNSPSLWKGGGIKPTVICGIYTVAGTGNTSYHQTKQSKFKLLFCQNLWRGDRKIYWEKCWWPAQSLNIFIARTVTNWEQLRVIWSIKISFHCCIYFQHWLLFIGYP